MAEIRTPAFPGLAPLSCLVLDAEIESHTTLAIAIGGTNVCSSIAIGDRDLAPPIFEDSLTSPRSFHLFAIYARAGCQQLTRHVVNYLHGSSGPFGMWHPHLTVNTSTTQLRTLLENFMHGPCVNMQTHADVAQDAVFILGVAQEGTK